jgi:TonB family protein
VPPAPGVAAALEATPEATNKEPGDLDAQFAFEILQRTQARDPRPVSGWTARAREHRGMLSFPMNYDDPMLKRLTVEEREAAQPPEVKDWKPAPRPKTPRTGDDPVIHMTTRFPPRFAPDLISVSGCKPSPHDLTGALIEYGAEGRPRKVAIADRGLSRECFEAGRALLLSALVPLGDTTESLFALVPLAPDVLACGEEQVTVPTSAPAGFEHVGGRIKEPKKLVNVPPLYPVLARQSGVQGTVILETTISRSGCVSDVTILQSVPKLDAAAMIAVMRWRYTPTLLDGEPVPVIMTVTVNFHLSP